MKDRDTGGISRRADNSYIS